MTTHRRAVRQRVALNKLGRLLRLYSDFARVGPAVVGPIGKPLRLHTVEQYFKVFGKPGG